jgi:hypothetical protein
MYLVHEENHDCLCVAHTVGSGLMWLIMNKWLDGNTIGILENEEEILMKDLVENSDTNPFLIFNHCVELQYKNGIESVMEFLEIFGIYFNEIEVA